MTMRRDLIKGGVDPADIVLDYAGFRTLDSVSAPAKCSIPTTSLSSFFFPLQTGAVYHIPLRIRAQSYAVPSPKDESQAMRLRSSGARGAGGYL